MSETVAVVLVTYNRKKLLFECLEAIRNQTHKPDAIFIIDNQSTDGTPELLYEKQYIPHLPNIEVKENLLIFHQIISLHNQEENIQIRYIRKSENDGGAGGFCEGIKQAYEFGYDWIWVMDDDVEPKLNAIEILLKWSSKSKIIQPSRVNYDGTRYKWGGDLLLSNGKENYSVYHEYCLQNKGYSIVTIGCFEGMFISREIVEKIGLPEKKYFIFGDDTIYGFVASLYSDIILINDELLVRKLPDKSKIIKIFGHKLYILNAFSVYYLIRNEFLKLKILRNHNLLLNKNNFYKRMFFQLTKEILKSILLTDFSRLKNVIIGYFDGLNGNFGRR